PEPSPAVFAGMGVRDLLFLSLARAFSSLFVAQPFLCAFLFVEPSLCLLFPCRGTALSRAKPRECCAPISSSFVAAAVRGGPLCASCGRGIGVGARAIGSGCCGVGSLGTLHCL